MKQMRTLAFLVLAMFINLLLVNSSCAADLDKGKQLYMNCAMCHGMNAEGVAAMRGPALAGLSSKYLLTQFNNFSKKIRGSDPGDTAGMTMAPMIMTLQSDDDKQNVAAYIASLEAQKPAATLAGDAAKGKALYATCAACHGANAEGVEMMNAPALVNQHDWYLKTQLTNFNSGVRGSKPEDALGGQMRSMAMMLTDEQAVLDVVAYIQSLQ